MGTDDSILSTNFVIADSTVAAVDDAVTFGVPKNLTFAIFGGCHSVVPSAKFKMVSFYICVSGFCVAIAV